MYTASIHIICVPNFTVFIFLHQTQSKVHNCKVSPSLFDWTCFLLNLISLVNSSINQPAQHHNSTHKIRIAEEGCDIGSDFAILEHPRYHFLHKFHKVKSH